MKINMKTHPNCYWIIQGSLNNDIPDRVRMFAQRENGLQILLDELNWEGGTIHQVINQLNKE